MSEKTNNFELLSEMAIESDGEVREYEVKGKKHSFVIAQFSDINEMLAVKEAITKREKAFDTFKGKLPVSIPKDIAEKYPTRFKDAVINGDIAEFNITKKDEVTVATTIEYGILDPKFSFNEAVVFGRLNGRITSTICKDIRELNDETAEEEAKNE